MFRTSSAFDKLLDKATSHLLLEPDWPTILQISDQIRQGDVQPKYALASIKKKLANSNPHVAMFALIVLESCVKNCGSLIHDEIGTKAYMEQLRDLVKTTPHDNVKNKVLELIQAWAFAFRISPKYRAVQDTMNIMKAEEYKFPVLKESDAMFSADTAPDWADADRCHRCRVEFSLVQRKHHCRACGQVFCSQCSNRTCTLPKFGIEKEVRVCEACYNKLSKPAAATKQNSVEELPVEYLTSSLAQQNQAPPPRKSEEELREEEELQLALALSQSEAEQKDKQKSSRSLTPTSRVKNYSPPPMSRDTSSPPMDDVDPELARYLNRSYWETRTTDESSPSAPSNPPSGITFKQNVGIEQNGVASDSEMEEFVRDLKSQVEIFVNRMKSNSSRGRSIANDSSVQKLFLNITAMHSKLLQYIQQQDDSRVYYEGLQDKLVQVKDARAALDALRDEHREKLRRAAEMAEIQRQRQMAQKLDIMRKKKQEYLQYQRQLTLQRFQEQEREMQMRQEQQKQQYLMGSQYGSLGYIPPGGYDGLPASGYSMPPGPVPPGFPHYPPQGIPGMMMPPQTYIPAHLGAPQGPMMCPVLEQMMSSLGPMPPQMMGQIPPNTSPAHLQGPQGAQGQIPGPQGQIHGPQGQISGPQGQMHGLQIQIPGTQSQMQGPQGQIPGSQSQMQGPQGQMLGSQGQMPGPQGQIPMSSSQTQIPNQVVSNQLQNPAQNQLGQVPQQVHQMPPQLVPQHQIVPGAPLSPTSNAQMQHPMMPPMGPPMSQGYQPQPQQPPQQEQTAELISFD